MFLFLFVVMKRYVHSSKVWLYAVFKLSFCRIHSIQSRIEDPKTGFIFAPPLMQEVTDRYAIVRLLKIGFREVFNVS